MKIKTSEYRSNVDIEECIRSVLDNPDTPISIVNNVKLSDHELVSLAEDYGEIIRCKRVGHIRMGGKIITLSSSRSKHEFVDTTDLGWHNDFSNETKPGPGYISFLHSKISPHGAGATEFISSTLNEETLNKIKSVGISGSEIVTHKGVNNISSNKLIMKDKATGAPYIYLGCARTSAIDGHGTSKNEKIIEILKENWYYKHEWHENQLVVFNNNLVMHKPEEYNLKIDRKIFFTCISKTHEL